MLQKKEAYAARYADAKDALEAAEGSVVDAIIATEENTRNIQR